MPGNNQVAPIEGTKKSKESTETTEQQTIENTPTPFDTSQMSPGEMLILAIALVIGFYFFRRPKK